MLQILNKYEGPCFRLQKSTAHLDTGQTVPAWVYLYSVKLTGKRRLACGDYFSTARIFEA